MLPRSLFSQILKTGKMMIAQPLWAVFAAFNHPQSLYLIRNSLVASESFHYEPHQNNLGLVSDPCLWSRRLLLVRFPSAVGLPGHTMSQCEPSFKGKDCPPLELLLVGVSQFSFLITCYCSVALVSCSKTLSSPSFAKQHPSAFHSPG